MSSRTLAAAKARRAGERAPPVSGNRPVTSIGSQAAFAQQLPPNMGYNMPPPPNNVRIAKAQPPTQYKQPPTQNKQPLQPPENSLPFSKLSVSDAIGLITLRLGRVEQWIIDTDNEENQASTSGGVSIPENHKLIDNAVFTTMINRLDALEKNKIGTTSVNGIEEIKEEIKQLKEQFERMATDMNKHTLEIAKNTEQVFKFNRELTETKDILKSFMLKYDMFAEEVTQNFSDYETALGEIENKLMNNDENVDNKVSQQDNDDNNNNDIETKKIDLKNMVKQELEQSTA